MIYFAMGWIVPALARPRPPLPPLPELTGPRLFHESFDWAYAAGLTHDEVVLANYGTLRASWSGMALQRSGKVTPFLVPGLDAAGHTNVASHAPSAARFWLTPWWASPAVGGTGQEKTRRSSNWSPPTARTSPRSGRCAPRGTVPPWCCSLPAMPGRWNEPDVVPHK